MKEYKKNYGGIEEDLSAGTLIVFFIIMMILVFGTLFLLPSHL